MKFPIIIGVAGILGAVLVRDATSGDLMLWRSVSVNSSRLSSENVLRDTRSLKSAVPCALACDRVPWCELWCIDASQNCLLSSLIVVGSFQDEDAQDILNCYTSRRPEYALGSSIYWNGACPTSCLQRSKENLVDGVYNGDIDTCARTKYQEKPWFLLDLGTPKRVQEVTLTAQPNTAASKHFRNIEVRVGQEYVEEDFSSYSYLGKFEGEGSQSLTVALRAPTPITGQFVSIQIFNKTFFQLCHLEVR